MEMVQFYTTWCAMTFIKERTTKLSQGNEHQFERGKLFTIANFANVNNKDGWRIGWRWHRVCTVLYTVTFRHVWARFTWCHPPQGSRYPWIPKRPFGPYGLGSHSFLTWKGPPAAGERTPERKFVEIIASSIINRWNFLPLAIDEIWRQFQSCKTFYWLH